MSKKQYDVIANLRLVYQVEAESPEQAEQIARSWCDDEMPALAGVSSASELGRVEGCLASPRGVTLTYLRKEKVQ